MIADDECGGEGRVDSPHHPEWARGAANDGDVRGEPFDQKVLLISVRIGDHDLRRAAEPHPFDRGERETQRREKHDSDWSHLTIIRLKSAHHNNFRPIDRFIS